MLDYQRRVAEFFAKLVSLDDIGKVPESERRELWQEYVTLCGALGSLALEDKAPSPPTKQVKFAALVTHLQRHPPQDPPPKYAKELARLQKMAREIIFPLLEGQTATLPSMRVPVRYVRVGPSATLLQTAVAEGKDVLLFELQDLFPRGAELPFRRCPACLKIFVPVRHQRYCTPQCTGRSIEQNRKYTKRIYMRAYMAEKRKAAKQATAA
jgi:hypothetical protein